MSAERIVAEGVEASLGEEFVRARPLSGGSIGEVYKAELSDGLSVVAKVDQTGGSYLEREAYMLRYLKSKTDLPVPEVYHSSDNFLLMEFVPGKAGGDLMAAEGHAAQLLAALHGVTADAYGHEKDTLTGTLVQPNPWTSSWVDFFRDNRLLYSARMAREAGRLPGELYDRVEELAGRLGDYVVEPGRPALIHGDVWGGNVLAQHGKVTAFLDPAIYHADPEMELAYIALFGTFGERFFDSYAEIRGIKDGFFEERRHIYGLYHLLVHVYFFGGSYVSSVENTLRRFGF